ncbi:arylsulfotransferase family protein, partial [Candidatus Altiarchaeota archaeon]
SYDSLAQAYASDDDPDPAASYGEWDSIGSRLASIGYLPYVVDDIDEKKEGVIRITDDVADGNYLYCPIEDEKVQLLDKTGAVIHEWSVPDGHPKTQTLGSFRVATLLPDGSIISLMEGKGTRIAKLDYYSNVLWYSKPGHFHHHATFDEKGNVYALKSRPRKVEYWGIGSTIKEDLIAIYSPAGKLINQVSLFDILEEGHPPLKEHIWKLTRNRKQRKPGDLTHMNTVKVIREDHPIGKKGQILTSSRKLNSVFIIDINNREIVWSWAGNGLRAPHQPEMLANGNILVFDNGDRKRRYSRILEIDPVSNEVVWEYSKMDMSFFSPVRGYVQRMPNGNTFITESTKGHAFEVTKEGEIVWQFLATDHDIVKGQKRRKGMVLMEKSPLEYVHVIKGRGRDPLSDDSVSDSAYSRLLSLGYLDYVKEDVSINEEGVIRSEPGTYDGLNVYPRDHDKLIQLFDTSGDIVHEWKIPRSDRLYHFINWFIQAQVLGDGSVIAITNTGHMVKLDFDSNVEWDVRLDRYHHDFFASEDGDIYALTAKDRKISFEGKDVWIRDDIINVISPGGSIKRGISVFDMLYGKNELLSDKLREINGREKRHDSSRAKDILHTNTIKLIREDGVIAKKGNIMVSSRRLDLVAIFDIEAEELVWSWGEDELEAPHQPDMLGNGNILVVDNGRSDRGYSRVIEYDPLKSEIVWQYPKEPDKGFFTEVRGYAQRQPNGNTLITDSLKGLVFEVTHDGERLWEFRSTDYIEVNGTEKRKSIIMMEKIRKDHIRLKDNTFPLL